jgi:TolA-binding protein
VFGSLLAGVFFGVQQAVVGSDVYEAFLKGVGAVGALMVLAGLGQRMYEGERMQGGQLPGGAGAQFEPEEAATKTRETVEQLNTRVTDLSEEMIAGQEQLDRRVAELENAVLKDGAPARENER